MIKDLTEAAVGAIEEELAELGGIASITVAPETMRAIQDLQSEWSEDDWGRPGPVDPATGTVVIVGKSIASSLVPWGEEGYEFWGLNDQGTQPWSPPISAHSRWFQLHPPHYLEVHYPRGIEDLKKAWGKGNGIPLYMDRHYEWIPDSVPYPKGLVESLTPKGWYHTSSFDWMVALAILEGWKRIELYGVDFYTFPTVLYGEPVAGRPCLEYWIGVAEGRGIEVEVVNGGDLFRNIHIAQYTSRAQYGFEAEPALDLSKADDGWKDVR